MKKKLVTAPSIDAIFKAIFERNLDLLSDFLSLVMKVDVSAFEDIKVTNPGLTPEQIGDKYAVLDLLVKMKTGEKINVEMQNRDEGNYIQRSVYNVSKLFTKDFRTGKDYSKLRRTVCINILQFNLFAGDEYKSTVYPIIEERNERLTDLWQIHFFETKKLPLEPTNRLERWLRFFTVKSEEELEMVRTQNDPMINKAVDVTLSMNDDEQMQILAWAREKRDLAEAAAKATAAEREKAMAENYEKLLKMNIFQGKLSIARNLILDGADESYAAKITGLSIDEVKDIKL
ncbi:MAG: Rpn family recombination-promoting nuclease/putative transposase [Ruminococcus sp.]|jgi:predicted transposase/invertase (TIGR01784 family)|nr:Rpn family recombination-promoting nuclease/putative transposase [Ruminococcus sp.]